MASARGVSAVAGTGCVVTVAALALVGSGVPVGAVGTWLGLLASGVVVPGFVAVRAVRGAGAVAEDLAWSVPVGLLLALATWAVGLLVLGSAVWPPWTGVVALAALAIPAVRRRVLVGGGDGWGLGTGAVVVASLCVTSAWAWGSALASFPLTPDRPFRWAPDVMFHTALVAELGRTTTPTYPMVPEGPYPYHWFFHALAAHLGRGFEPLVVVTHLLPLTLLLAVVAMAAVAARAVAGRRWGAAAGAVLVGALGATQPGAWVVLSGITGRSDTDGAGLDPIRLYWQHSASTTLGWLAALAALAVVARILRDGVTRSGVVLLVAMGILAAGGKSSQTPVLLCGVAAVLGWAALRRRRALLARGAAVGACLLAPWALALVTLYGAGSQGLVLDPGRRADLIVDRLAPALGGTAPRVEAVVVAVALWLLPLTPRLLGLLWWARRPLDPVGLFCAATVVAGGIGSFLTAHPGGSDVFLLVSAYPVGVVGSAAGLVLALEVLRERWGWRRVALVGGGAAAVGLVATAVVARAAGAPAHLAGLVGPVLALGAVVVVLGLGAVVALRGPRRLGVLVVTTVALLGGGAVATGRDVLAGRPDAVAARVDAVVARAPARTRLLVTPALWEAAGLVRREATPFDVVVTNRRCVQPATVLARQPCDPREFTVAALTGRRTGVSGWAYAPESLARAAQVPGGYTRMPFWDPPRLSAQLELVEDPTPERAAAAWRRGERWVLADRAAGPVSDRLATVGIVELDRDGVVLLRLTPPRS